MYYAAVNSYATETSRGFCNTWSVIGFELRATRDAYVQRATDLATTAIKAAEIRRFGGKRGEVNFFDATGCLWEYDDWASLHRESALRICPQTANAVDDGIDHEAVAAYWDDEARKGGYID